MKDRKEAAIGKTMQGVMEPPIQKIKDLGRDKIDMVSFAQGLPWFGPPEKALDRAMERLRRGEGNGYSPTAGRESLRGMLAEDLRRRGIEGATPERVLTTPGGNQAIYILLAVLADRGDEAILIRPYYFNNLMALQMLGIKPVFVDAEADGAVDPSRVKRAITRRTRAMIVISPNNPSGAVLDPGNIEALAVLAREKGIWLIADEAYRDFAWERPHVSPLALAAENVAGVYSFSKSFGMAGWRLGFLHAPVEVVAQAAKAADTLHICPGLPAQLLAEEALAAEPRYPAGFREEMQRSRDLLAAALAPLHAQGRIGEAASAGGFYLFLPLDAERARSGGEVAERLVLEHAVAVVPGEAFGMERRPFLRLSYGNLRPAAMAAAAPRLAAALAAVLGG
jgi:aspartate/methionine/tyrosine aminotransferase